MKRNLFFILIALLSTQFFSCSFGLDEMFYYTDKDYSKYYNSSSSSETETYGSYSDVPSDAVELTVDAMNGAKYSFKTDYISTSEYQYYYFYASYGTTYYITWYDKYCCPDQLDYWNYSNHADIGVGGCFSGAQDDISDYIDGTTSSTSYGYTYQTMNSSGYYVLKVKAYYSGYYGIRVSTSLP
ncbi:MAG: hypothetical protein WCQ67_04440 [Treponema sp.]